LSFDSFGQEFLGIKVDGKLNEVVAKFKQIQISYDNFKNYEIRDKEESKLKKDIF
jgi:hypothetical protein